MSSVDAPEDEAATTEETDELRTGLLAALEEELGDQVVGHHLRPNDDLWVRVSSEAWRETGDVLRHKLAFPFFDYLSAIDWRPSPFGRYEDAEVDDEVPLHERIAEPFEITTGVAGGDTRFQLIARVFDPLRRHVGIHLKADVPDDTMTMPSWVRNYAGADWHERETWEMFGITFEGHPHLAHIYLPTEFEGFPLRKDFPLLARVVKPWPGIVDVEPMPGGGDEEEEATEAEAAE